MKEKIKHYFKSPSDGIIISALFSTVFQPEVRSALYENDYGNLLKYVILYFFVAFFLFAIGFSAVDTILANSAWLEKTGRWRRWIVTLYTLVIYVIVAWLVLYFFR